MTTQEFSDKFDTLLNSYSNQLVFGDLYSKADIVLDEYEKSLFLTLAQEDIVKSFYTGNVNGGDSFESNERIRRYLDTLVKIQVSTSEVTTSAEKINSNSKFFALPEDDDLWFIVYEGVTLLDSSLKCDGPQEVSVVPTKHDNLLKVLKNPFRRPNERRVLRLDITGDMVELISKYNISKYIIRYISKPEPIILTSLPDNLTINGISVVTECKLNSVIHDTILKKAVQLALASKIGNISKQ